jgi:hypothetical protein
MIFDIDSMLGDGASEGDPAKGAQVHHLRWTDKEGNPGSAWIAQKSQLNTILQLLKMQKCVDIEYLFYVVPREKTALVGWLRNSGMLPANPARRKKIE